MCRSETRRRGANRATRDPHSGQFADVDKVTRCVTCHNTAKWRPSLFDHEKTAFPLQGAHQAVRCQACHTNVKMVDEDPVLFYKPTPTACSACHGTAGSHAQLHWNEKPKQL